MTAHACGSCAQAALELLQSLPTTAAEDEEQLMLLGELTDPPPESHLATAIRYRLEAKQMLARFACQCTEVQASPPTAPTD